MKYIYNQFSYEIDKENYTFTLTFKCKDNDRYAYYYNSFDGSFNKFDNKLNKNKKLKSFSYSIITLKLNDILSELEDEPILHRFLKYLGYSFGKHDTLKSSIIKYLNALNHKRGNVLLSYIVNNSVLVDDLDRYFIPRITGKIEKNDSIYYKNYNEVDTKILKYFESGQLQKFYKNIHANNSNNIFDNLNNIFDYLLFYPELHIEENSIKELDSILNYFDSLVDCKKIDVYLEYANNKKDEPPKITYETIFNYDILGYLYIYFLLKDTFEISSMKNDYDKFMYIKNYFNFSYKKLISLIYNIIIKEYRDISISNSCYLYLDSKSISRKNRNYFFIVTRKLFTIILFKTYFKDLKNDNFGIKYIESSYNIIRKSFTKNLHDNCKKEEIEKFIKYFKIDSLFYSNNDIKIYFNIDKFLDNFYKEQIMEYKFLDSDFNILETLPLSIEDSNGAYLGMFILKYNLEKDEDEKEIEIVSILDFKNIKQAVDIFKEYKNKVNDKYFENRIGSIDVLYDEKIHYSQNIKLYIYDKLCFIEREYFNEIFKK